MDTEPPTSCVESILLDQPRTKSLLDQLLPYVPVRVLKRMSGSFTSLKIPTPERFDAAMLLADISGFTPLAERLAEKGPVGTEALTTLLNAYFDVVIQCVTQYGGEVVSFAGDALIALWPSEGPGQLSAAALEAVRCGLTIQARVARLDLTQQLKMAVGEDTRLTLRVSVGAGEAIVANLGGIGGRWQFLTTGEPYKQVARADRLARPGQVVASELVWRLVADQCLGQVLEESFVRVDAAMEDDRAQPNLPSPLMLKPGSSVRDAEEVLRGYAPAMVVERLQAGQTDWMAELRRVSVLFVNLGQREIGTGASFQQMQEVVCSVQQLLNAMECSRVRVEADEKGIVLIAAFGLPPLTHEDDAARAVLSALGLLQRLRGMGLFCSIGISTGRIWSGIVGNGVRRDYTLIGDTVNLAARLMQSAEGSILCDLNTWQGTQGRVNFEVLNAIQVKGKHEPVAVFRPIERRAPGIDRLRSSSSGVPIKDLELLGRQTERQLLKRQLNRLTRGESGLIVLEGEAGIGKSRLLLELREHSRQSSALLLVGGGDAITRSMPYHAWRPIFAQLYNQGTPDGDTELNRARILARLQLEPPWSELAPLLNPVLPLDLPETTLTLQMTSKARGEQTHQFLLHLLRENARMVPLLVQLDDAHWMDSASWALALAAVQQVHPLLMVVATRPFTEPSAELQSLLQHPGATWISLRTLSEEDTGRLIAQRLGVRNVPTGLRQLVHERSNGQPLFCEEILDDLRARSLLQLADGEVQFEVEQLTTEPELPRSLEGLITSRIDRLSPAQQLTAKVASVVGRPFSYQLLHDIHPIDADRKLLRETLQALEKMEILQSIGSGMTESGLAQLWSFRQATTREAVYQLMVHSQRQELHRAIARWYESHSDEDLRPYFGLLAWHYEQAGMWEQTLEALERAGEQALGSYGLREGIRFLTEALALLKRPECAQLRPSPLRQARWLQQLGEAYISMGELKSGCESLEAALRLLGRGRPSRRERLWVDLALACLVQLVHLMFPSFLVGRRAGNEALLVAAQACERLSESAIYSQEKVWGIYNAVQCLNLAESYGPSPELARGYGNMCLATGVMARHSLALFYQQKAQETARIVHHLHSTAWVLFSTAVYDVGIGRLLTARDAFIQAGTHWWRLGDRRHWEMATAWQAWVQASLGQLHQALELNEAMTRSSERRDDKQTFVWGVTGTLAVLLRLGDEQRAMELLKSTELSALPEANRLERLSTQSFLALADWHQGNEQQALESLAELSRSLGRVDFTVSTLNALGAMAEVYTLAWLRHSPGTQPSEALRNGLTEQVKLLRSFSRRFPVGIPQRLLWKGWLLHLEGQTGRGTRAWRQSIRFAKAFGLPFEEACAWIALAQVAPTGSSKRSQALEKAQRLAVSLDARRLMAQVHQLEQLNVPKASTVSQPSAPTV